MKSNEVFNQNEKHANATVAKVMTITFGIFSLIYILNILGIFIIKMRVMTIAYVLSGMLLLAPRLLNAVFGTEHKSLKYVYVAFSGLFIFIITTLLTYHAVVVYAYPVAVAGLYFRKKVTVYATIISIICTVSGQFAGFFLGWQIDHNVENIYELVFFSIIPKLLSLTAFSALFFLLTYRTDDMLMEQNRGTDELINLSSDIITGFANLVEDRDENTGGHIKRTGLYVELLAKELKARKLFLEIDDAFIENLRQAAPLHDIGKIAVPDSVLKKAGKLDPEEYEMMKIHTIKGGEIIQGSFKHVADEAYRKVAYNVAKFHHEKWNGKGYPEGLIGDSIPLCARIMSVADVFDAVSQNRCYRAALPFDTCFEIIRNGMDKDFDPLIASVFLDLRPKIEKIYIEILDT